MPYYILRMEEEFTHRDGRWKQGASPPELISKAGLDSILALPPGCCLPLPLRLALK